MLCSGCAADLRRELARDVPYADLEAYWCARRQDLNELRVVDLRADRVRPAPGPAPSA